MAEAVSDGFGDSRIPLSTVRNAVEAVQALALDPFGIEVTHVLSPNYAETEQLAEVCLVAEIRGEPSYFDIFGAQDVIAARLGIDVMIIPRRSVWESHRTAFEGALLPL